jgi:MFS family permease
MTQSNAAPRAPTSWRTPVVIIVCGCLIGMIGFGPRSSLGFFLTPLSSENGWGREIFAFALAIQNLLWGVGQPFAGAIADRYGTDRVLIVGSLLCHMRRRRACSTFRPAC